MHSDEKATKLPLMLEFRYWIQLPNTLCMRFILFYTHSHVKYIFVLVLLLSIVFWSMTLIMIRLVIFIILSIWKWDNFQYIILFLCYNWLIKCFNCTATCCDITYTICMENKVEILDNTENPLCYRTSHTPLLYPNVYGKRSWWSWCIYFLKYDIYVI